MSDGWMIILAGGCAGLLTMGIGYAADRVCYRRASLNANPGIYVRAWGKWYRVIRVKP